MSVEDFGVLNAVNSLGILVGAFLGVIPYVVSKYIIEFKNDLEMSTKFLWDIFRVTTGVMIILSLSVIVLADSIKNYLNLSEYLPIYIFLIYLVSGVIMSVFFGVMQGLLLYVEVSVKGALVALIRLLLAVILVVWLGYSYNGALFAAMVANVIIGIWVYTIVIKHIPFVRTHNTKFSIQKYKEMAIYAIPVALTWLAIGIITNIDVVLVKHYTSDIEAGEYSVAAVIARIAVFLPGVLLSVLFPQILQNNADGKSSLGTLYTVMGLTLLLSFGFAFIVHLFPEFIISVLFGAKYLGASGEIVIITYAMALVAVISVLYNFLLAKRLYSYLYVTFLGIIVTGLYIHFMMHHNAMEIAQAILYGCATILLANSLLLMYYYFVEIKNSRKNKENNA